jgi:hypothetical protein
MEVVISGILYEQLIIKQINLAGSELDINGCEIQCKVEYATVNFFNIKRRKHWRSILPYLRFSKLCCLTLQSYWVDIRVYTSIRFQRL